MSNINVISKTVTSAGTPEVLGSVTQRFKCITFLGFKGNAETANTGTIYVQARQMLADGTPGDWISMCEVVEGGYGPAVNLNTADDGNYNASMFRIKVSTDGDGVVAIVGS
jgi:hypothetical protein